MGDQDEDQGETARLEDILVFDEKDLDGYASEVQLFFAETGVLFQVKAGQQVIITITISQFLQRKQ
jgi:hypothetical protein